MQVRFSPSAPQAIPQRASYPQQASSPLGGDRFEATGRGYDLPQLGMGIMGAAGGAVVGGLVGSIAGTAIGTALGHPIAGMAIGVSVGGVGGGVLGWMWGTHA